MSETKILPDWAEDLRKRYLRGESSMFILHGNVYDVVLSDGKMLGLTEFLTDVLLKESRESIVVYNVSSGARFPKKTETFADWQSIAVESDKAKVLTMLERSIRLTEKTAVLLEYAETITPAGDASFQMDADRSAIVTLHRWSFCPKSSAATTSLF